MNEEPSEVETKVRSTKLNVGDNLGCVLVVFIIAVAWTIISVWGH